MFLSFFLSFSPSLPLSLSLYLYISIYLYISLSLCLSVSLYIYISISLYLPSYLSLSLSLSLSIYLSISVSLVSPLLLPLSLSLVLEYDRKPSGELGQLGMQIRKKRFESYNQVNRRMLKKNCLKSLVSIFVWWYSISVIIISWVIMIVDCLIFLTNFCSFFLLCHVFFLFRFIKLIFLNSLLDQVWLSSSSEKTSERQGGVRYEGGFNQEEKVLSMSPRKCSHIFNFITNSMICLR